MKNKWIKDGYLLMDAEGNVIRELSGSEQAGILIAQTFGKFDASTIDDYLTKDEVSSNPRT